MPEQTTTPGSPSDLHAVLEAAHVASDVFELRPDYRVVLVAVDGIEPGPGDQMSEELLAAAEASAAQDLAQGPVTEVPHVAAWREAYRSFGAKPQRTRNSLEALMRRAAAGLPRVNRLTDVYNAISVLHRIPLGGEDLARYDGAPRLVRATGEESFDTAAGGETVLEHPDPGEVVWRDASGVTCRRWNWRQCRRTALTDQTTSAVFILDALEPLDDDALQSAADELAAALRRLGPDVTVATRWIGAP
ncbi:B3/B4 domain-containing protein [Zhihengliuella halotolerans]|uniref:DNA/RNA-binding domain of Phe-tRNA-synthetase-like protein n=1 Tax=Zhihengliuella halotolerans TaxID=370736 RepID=A0A4Q8AFG2_9MICC|nr:phenylalanine--tRNA ligase beta subunit-related protein [Zhihengliuella halotolerans]RZU63057.1 DNA/RNA-binding domain of Phe-tRNA-synthetase-like protein [Zhihengliuella halotolerans]